MGCFFLDDVSAASIKSRSSRVRCLVTESLAGPHDQRKRQQEAEHWRQAFPGPLILWLPAIRETSFRGIRIVAALLYPVPASTPRMMLDWIRPLTQGG